MKFRDLSIQKKFILVELLVVFVVLALSESFHYLNDSANQRATITTKLASLAGLIGYNCTAALNFLDRDDAAKTLRSLEAEPQITGAWVLDAAGRVFASYGTQGFAGVQPDGPVRDHEDATGRTLTLSRRIRQEDETIGAVVLAYDLAPFRKILLRNLLWSGLALLGGMVIAGLLVFVSRRALTAPILYLVGIMGHVSKTKDLSVRVLERRKDEIGILYREFDNLLAEINTREKERDRAAAALRGSEEKYRTLVESANSIILRWTRDGRVIFLNEFGQRFFGYPEAEIVGRSVLGTIVPESEDGGRNLRILMDEICRNPAAFEQNINENQLRGGERVWIAWTNKVVLDEGGEIAEILSIGQDITARKKAEDELRALKVDLERRVAERTRELASANERLVELDRLKSMFLASMSHELRTPLNSILGFSGLIMMGLSGPLNAEQTKQMTMVQGSAKHLLNLINDILDISKIESGNVDLRIEPFSLAELTTEVLGEVALLAKSKSLTLTAGVSDDLVLQSDRRRVKQVLTNLLGNAIKFSDRGFIRVEAAAEGEGLSVSVSDQGIGIRLEDQDKLFRPFRQVDMSSTKQFEGTGLGLYLCRKLLGMLHGAISVRSEYGRGSTFTFVLPKEWKDAAHEESSDH